MERAPPSSAIEAITRAHWPALLPRLLCAAGGYLRVCGWAEDARHQHHALEPRELVNLAIDGCLSGKRQWVPSAGATEESLVAFLCETMHSIATNQRTIAAIARRGSVDEVDDLQDNRPSPSRRLAAKEHIARIAEALAGDPEALAVHRLICQGYVEREEIAEALGWTVARVKAVRLRASRRLALQHLSLTDDGPPPGSGP